MNKENRKKILIVKLSSIGDVIMATPAPKAIKDTYPDSYIVWIVEPKSAQAVIGNPYIDEVINWDRTPFGKYSVYKAIKNTIDMIKKVRSHKFDIAVDLQGLLRSAVITKISGAKIRLGFDNAGEGAPLFYTIRHDAKLGYINPQQRSVDILTNIGVMNGSPDMYMPVAADDRDFANSFFAENNLNGKIVIACIPATTWPNKHWTVEAWAETIDMLKETYNAKSVILGAPSDIPLANKIVNLAKHKPVVCAGKTTLNQAGAIIEKCRVSVGVDTGLLHMSVALKIPTIGIFGPSEWRGFMKRSDFIWLAKDYECSPCRRHPICKDYDCMRAITSDDVKNALKPWLEMSNNENSLLSSESAG